MIMSNATPCEIRQNAMDCIHALHRLNVILQRLDDYIELAPIDAQKETSRIVSMRNAICVSFALWHQDMHMTLSGAVDNKELTAEMTMFFGTRMPMLITSVAKQLQECDIAGTAHFKDMVDDVVSAIQFYAANKVAVIDYLCEIDENIDELSPPDFMDVMSSMQDNQEADIDWSALVKKSA